MTTTWRRAATATAAAVVGALLTAAPASAADPVTITLLDVNDFHGRIDANTVKVAGTVEQERAKAGEANTLFLSAGDNIGASLFASSSQQDAPTLDVLNALGLAASAVGNHELDRGAADLTGRVSQRAEFPYLAANMIDTATGKPVLPASRTFTVGGLKVAVVGAITQETGSLVSPDGIKGLEFTDPVKAVNDTVAQLEASADKPDVVVASFHEGAGAGMPEGASLEQEVAAGGAFADIVTKTDARVDAIFTGHTHKQYAWDAPIPGASGTRPVLQTGSYGENLGRITLSVDPDTDAVTAHTATNVPRTTTADADLVAAYPRVAKVKTITDAALAQAKTIGQRPVGQVTSDITTAYSGGKRDDRANESTLGTLVSDATLSAVEATPAGADLSVVNPGGLRSDLLFDGTGGTDTDGVVTYAEADAVLPFANTLGTVTLSGASLKKVFEQQWQRRTTGPEPSRPYLQLGTSSNVRYTADPSRPLDDRITSIWVDDRRVEATTSYKVAVPSFLGAGGDNFVAFKDGRFVDSGLIDSAAWVDYLGAKQPVSPSFARHAGQVQGVKDSYRPGASFTATLPKLDLTSLGAPATTSASATIRRGDETLKSLGSTKVTGGSATFASTLPAGETGDLVLDVRAYPSGTRVTVPLDVRGATVTAMASGATFGGTAKVSVDVTADGNAPTGTVKVLAGSTELGTATLSDGAADVPVDTARIGAGTSQLTVVYDGAGDLPTARTTTSIDVAKAGTTTTAEASGAARRGAPATITADVASATGTTPTGTVTVRDGEKVLGTGTLAASEDGAGDEGATADVSVDTDDLPVGSSELTVAYAGDDDHESSTTTTELDLAKGVVQLTATAPASVRYGTSGAVTVKADVGATGLVFVSDGTSLVGVGTIADGKGSVRVSRTALKPGRRDLTVSFNGSADHEPATTTVPWTVQKAVSTTTAKASPTSIKRRANGASVKVAVTAPGFTVDGGAVTVVTSGKTIATGTVVGGAATIKLPAFGVTGKRVLTVRYAGNDLAGDSSATTAITVRSK